MNTRKIETPKQIREKELKTRIVKKFKSITEYEIMCGIVVSLVVGGMYALIIYMLDYRVWISFKPILHIPIGVLIASITGTIATINNKHFLAFILVPIISMIVFIVVAVPGINIIALFFVCIGGVLYSLSSRKNTHE